MMITRPIACLWILALALSLAACDPPRDLDHDGVDDKDDNCLVVKNPEQRDSDGDGVGDACDLLNDRDGDGVADERDNCPAAANPDQRDSDRDGQGDACDALTDWDRDGVADESDNCPYASNPDQDDGDGDGIGDVCDAVTAQAAAGTLRAEVTSYTAASAEFTLDLFAVAPDAELYTLGEDAFSIAAFEWRGVRAEFAHTETTPASLASGPYSATLLLDQSAGMAEADPDDARLVAAEAFMDNLSAGAEAGLIAYAAGGRLDSPTISYGDPERNWFTMDADGFDWALQALADLEGGTRPLYDAVEIAADYTARHATTAKRMVLALTGGDDAGSTSTLAAAVEAANRHGVAIHTVVLSRGIDQAAELATKTGGSISFLTDAAQLVSYYGAVGGIVSGEAAFYRTTWRLSMVRGRLYPGYWIRAYGAIETPDGTVYAPFRLDFE